MTPPKIKKIAIAGAGGIGSHLVAILFDFGVNRGQFDFTGMEIDLFDDDVVEIGNLLHQNFSEADLGKKKVDSLAERFLVNPIDRFMVEADFPKYDLIFSCVDSMRFRATLYRWSWANPDKAFWIDGRCESRLGSVFNKTLKKERLETMISDEDTRASCLRTAEKEQKISHTTPLTVASISAQTFLNFLRGERSLPEKIFQI